jgi:hypothetical protein
MKILIISLLVGMFCIEMFCYVMLFKKTVLSRYYLPDFIISTTTRRQAIDHLALRLASFHLKILYYTE